MDSTKPYPARGGVASDANGRPANRKSERMARRELLYTVVRDVMAKAGVLSASYKFKVLSLDGRGRQFLVMIDLARECGSDSAALAEIEAMVAQSAKARFDIIVTAVYWRMNDHVALGATAGAMAGKASVRAPVSHAQHAPVAPQPALSTASSASSATFASAAPSAAVPAARAGTPFEPIHNDEVEAFRRALATGAATPAVTAAAATTAAAAVAASAPSADASGGAVAKDFGGAVHHGPRSYTLLTGFEDTELAEGEQQGSAALSATQYGELR